MDVKGAIVTIDAMGCQKAIAGKIIQRGKLARIRRFQPDMGHGFGDRPWFVLPGVMTMGTLLHGSCSSVALSLLLLCERGRCGSLYDPGLEDTFSGTLDALVQDNSNETKCAHVTGVLTSLIDQLAESSQMTTEQQALLKSIHAVLDRTE